MKSPAPLALLAVILSCVLLAPRLQADEKSKVPPSPETGISIKFIPADGGAFGKTKPGYWIESVAGDKPASGDAMIADSAKLQNICLKLGRSVVYQGVWILQADPSKYSKDQLDDFENFKSESSRMRIPVYTCLESELPNWKKVE